MLQIGIATALHKDHKVDLEQIAVLTPYSAQKNLINKKLKEAELDVKVASITESQGEYIQLPWNHGYIEGRVTITSFCR